MMTQDRSYLASDLDLEGIESISRQNNFTYS